jgi:hypothetical protein
MPSSVQGRWSGVLGLAHRATLALRRLTLQKNKTGGMRQECAVVIYTGNCTVICGKLLLVCVPINPLVNVSFLGKTIHTLPQWDLNTISRILEIPNI